MRLRWTTPAAEDLYQITQYIRKDNPDAARRVAKLLYEGCALLRSFPRSGRPGRIANTRELIIEGLPYIIVYTIKGEVAEILRIYHGAQDRP